MNRQEQIIWASGFFDGEGCISVWPKTKRKATHAISYNMSMAVFQNDRTPLDLLCMLFGGNIRRRDIGWFWTLSGQPTVNALEAMIPYLIVKRSQAEVARSFQARRVPRGGKYPDPAANNELNRIDYEKMRNLKLVVK